MKGLFITFTTYALIVLCELGDKTQLATLMLASNNPAKRWLVFGSAALALCSCVAVEVTIGHWLAQYVGIGLINRLTGILFIIIGAAILLQLAVESWRQRPRLRSRLQWEKAN